MSNNFLRLKQTRDREEEGYFSRIDLPSREKNREIRKKKKEKRKRNTETSRFSRDWNSKRSVCVGGGRGEGTNRFVLIVRHVRLSRRGGGEKERSVRPYRQQTTRLFLERSGVRYTIIMTRDEPWTCPTISGAAYETATPRGCLLHTALHTLLPATLPLNWLASGVQWPRAHSSFRNELFVSTTRHAY